MVILGTVGLTYSDRSRLEVLQPGSSCWAGQETFVRFGGKAAGRDERVRRYPPLQFALAKSLKSQRRIRQANFLINAQAGMSIPNRPQQTTLMIF
jgi:hypothetical protein